MDRDRIAAELAAVADAADADNPPMLALVVLANGQGLAYPYALWNQAAGDPVAEAARERLIYLFLVDFLDHMETRMKDAT